MRVVVASTFAALVAAPVASAQAPPALRAAIHAAGLTQRSVHYVSVSTASTGTVTIVGDAGRDRGIQRITVRLGGKTGHVTVVVAASTAYVYGDAFSLHRFLGFKSVGATKYAGVWILVPATSKAYAPVAAAVTLPSAIDLLGPQGRMTVVPPGTVAGRRVVGVRGNSVVNGGPVLDTLYACASGKPLPVKEVVFKPGFRSTNVLSRWNEPVHVRVPRKTVPIATVLATKGGPAA